MKTTLHRFPCLPALALMVGVLAVGSMAQAATITFDTPVTIVDDTVLDTPFSFAGAAFVQALNFGGTTTTVTTAALNSITFTGYSTTTNAAQPDVAPGSTTLYNTGYQTLSGAATGNADFDAVLNSDAWHNAPTDATNPIALTLTGLTPGQTYVLSLFSFDGRFADRSQAYYDTFSGGVFSGGASESFSQQPMTMVIGTFTADATTQSVYVSATDFVDNADTTISAFSLYSASAVPEPGTVAMVGFGLFGLLVRRRHRRDWTH